MMKDDERQAAIEQHELETASKGGVRTLSLPDELFEFLVKWAAYNRQASGQMLAAAMSRNDPMMVARVKMNAKHFNNLDAALSSPRPLTVAELEDRASKVNPTDEVKAVLDDCLSLLRALVFACAPFNVGETYGNLASSGDYEVHTFKSALTGEKWTIKRSDFRRLRSVLQGQEARREHNAAIDEVLALLQANGIDPVIVDRVKLLRRPA